MIDRITTNEERLKKALECINNLQESINKLNDTKEDIVKLNKYYGSKNWFKDKKLYEENKIEKIPAGVLSEDSVWNMYEDLNSLVLELKLIVDSIKEEE